MRVVVAEDNTLLREGVARLLEDAGMQVVGRFEDADAMLAAVREDEPDVAIVDIRLPPTHSDEGLRAAREICTRFPETGVLVLSQYAERAYAAELLACGGGVGYLLKDRVAEVEEFNAAVRRIAAGETVLDPSL
jgi:DNA-binding NarL/FixJ family response regulator